MSEFKFFLACLIDGPVSESGNKTGSSSVTGSGFAAVIDSPIFLMFVSLWGTGYLHLRCVFQRIDCGGRQPTHFSLGPKCLSITFHFATAI